MPRPSMKPEALSEVSERIKLYEDGNMDEEEITDLFQTLVDRDLLPFLPHKYEAAVEELIKSGKITAKPEAKPIDNDT